MQSEMKMCALANELVAYLAPLGAVEVDVRAWLEAFRHNTDKRVMAVIDADDDSLECPLEDEC